ncbi:MAG: TatD family hydrolase [Algisphaera sp.]
MIDTHCHLTSDRLNERVEEVIADAHEAGVDRMISVGTSPDDSAKAIALAERVPCVFATAGLHPGYSEHVTDYVALKETLGRMLDHPKVVALGEMGLDHHYPDPPDALQRPAFAVQLELMVERPGIVGVIHNREATDDTLAMIADHGVDASRLVFHCFTGSVDEIDLILATGAMVSFTGIVTFGSAQNVAEASDRVPLERLMIETDSPYLTPKPFRKVRTNEPKYVPHVAQFLAHRRNISLDTFTTTVDANAERFFGLPEAALG